MLTNENYIDINTIKENINNNFQEDQSNIENSNEEIPIKVYQVNKKTLKTFIIEWLSLDDQIKVYRDSIKELTDEKKQYENQILELMNIIKQDKILTDKGNIERNIKTIKSPLTTDLIKLTLTDILKCQQTADIYTNHILDKRTLKETINLKRNKKKN